MNSFATAIAGAALNVLLNLLFIPHMGAIGAAIATLASYGLVLLLRMLDVPRLLPFRLCLPRLLASLAFLFAACYLMTARPAGWWLPALLGCTVITVGINALPLMRSVREMFAARRT